METFFNVNFLKIFGGHRPMFHFAMFRTIHVTAWSGLGHSIDFQNSSD